MERPDRIMIGKVTAAVGLRGEVRIYPYTDNLARFAPGARLTLSDGNGRDDAFAIRAVRFSKKTPVVAFDGVTGREDAEGLRGLSVCVGADELPPLPEDTYYVRDLIGCAVFDENGDRVGEIGDVLQNGAQDVYEIIKPNKYKILLPAVAAFVTAVDVAGRRVEARLPDGLPESPPETPR